MIGLPLCCANPDNIYLKRVNNSNNRTVCKSREKESSSYENCSSLTNAYPVSDQRGDSTLVQSTKHSKLTSKANILPNGRKGENCTANEKYHISILFHSGGGSLSISLTTFAGSHVSSQGRPLAWV